LTGTVKSILPAAYDSGWTPISLPDYNGDRICQACAYDPVHDKLYMYGGDNGGMYGGDAGVGREVSCLARYDEVSDLARYDR
jgi:hypothetical protein